MSASAGKPRGMEHDARTYVQYGRGVRRPYGWSCLKCPARQGGYATGDAAKRGAIAHNGGRYYEQEGWSRSAKSVYGTCYGCGSKDVGKHDAYCAACVADDPSPAEQLATFDAYHRWADSCLTPRQEK